MLSAAGRVDHVLEEIRRILAPDGRLLVYTRARQAEGDRLDPHKGAQRLAARMTERADEGDAEIGRAVPMEQQAVLGACH